MSIDDAFAQLSRHRPRQSVYLQLLRATRLNPLTHESQRGNPDVETKPETDTNVDASIQKNVCTTKDAGPLQHELGERSLVGKSMPDEKAFRSADEPDTSGSGNEKITEVHHDRKVKRNGQECSFALESDFMKNSNLPSIGSSTSSSCESLAIPRKNSDEFRSDSTLGEPESSSDPETNDDCTITSNTEFLRNDCKFDRTEPLEIPRAKES